MKSIVKAILFSALLISITGTPLYAQKKVNYGGYFEIGGRVEYKDVYAESFYRAKLEFGIKVNDKIKVELDIRGDSEDRQFRLYEASVTFKFNHNFKLEAGALKKRYGLEEQISHEKLATITESMVNEYLDPLGYVNRDPGVQLYWTDDSNASSVMGGIHYNESHRLTIVSRINRAGLLGLKNAGLSFQFSKENRQDMPDTYALNLDLSHEICSANIDFEAFLGQDPVESLYRAVAGNPVKVEFFGLRSLLTKKYSVDSDFLTGIEPVLMGSFLVKDINQFDVNSVQLLVGCSFYFDDDVRFMINGNLNLSNHSYCKTERNLYGSNVIGQLQIRW